MSYSGKRIRAVLDAQGRRHRWLAQQLGVTPEHVSHMLAGRRRVTEPMARRMAEILGVPLFYFAIEMPDDSASLSGGDSRDAA